MVPLMRENGGSLESLENPWRLFGDLGWEQSRSERKPRTGVWIAALSLSTLVLIMYASVLVSLARQWWDDPNYGHSFFVPVLAGYILWRGRDRWRGLPCRANNFGLAIMLFAIALRILGMLGAELFMVRLSLVILISGIVLFLAGRQTLRSVAFPIGYLLFMIPLPGIVTRKVFGEVLAPGPIVTVPLAPLKAPVPRTMGRISSPFDLFSSGPA